MPLRRDIDKLKKDILALSAVVEDSVRKAVLAAENRDGKMAQSVIEGDKQVDAMEVDLERIEESQMDSGRVRLRRIPTRGRLRSLQFRLHG